MVSVVEVGVAVLATLVLTVVVGGSGVAVVRVVTRRWSESPRPRSSLEDRLQDLEAMMASATRVMGEVHAELEARRVLAERYRREAETARDVGQLSQQQRLAVARLLRRELAEEVSVFGRRNFWQGLVLNVFFFAAGVAASVVVTLLVQPLE